MSHKNRFVRPAIDILPISHGDTLTVRRRLTHGEEQDAYARMYLAGVDGQLKVNPLQAGMALVTSYLLDWTLRDEDGKVVPILDKPMSELEATLRALAPEDFSEVKAAIEAHEQRQMTARLEGKQPDGEKKSPAISPSPDAAGGATNGSES